MFAINKRIDTAIQMLIFCLALNIFHLGQFMLPVICLLLFVDNGFKLKVKNTKIFAVLSLFSVFFFIFSYRMGFYSVMGFCLPMAYYIGNNLNTNEENVKKLIYIIVLGMGVHVLLNFFYDFTIYGTELFRHTSHYDIWLQAEAMPTAVATNYMILTGCIYYLLVKEKKVLYKYGLLAIYAVMMIYNITIGRRTPFLMLGICLVLCAMIDFGVYGSNKKILKRILAVSALILVIFAIFWTFDLFKFKTTIYWLPFLVKFRNYGLGTGRIEILLDGIKMMPSYLWGGQKISGLLDIQIHDLLMDIYDFAGIVPFVLMGIFVIYELYSFIKIIRNKKNSSDFKLLLIGVYASMYTQAALEPLMTGASIFLISMVMIMASAEADRY